MSTTFPTGWAKPGRSPLPVGVHEYYFASVQRTSCYASGQQARIPGNVLSLVALMISKVCRDRGSVVTLEQRKTSGTSGRAKRVEPAAITRLATADPSDISSLIEPYRRELHLHCYRLLGPLRDADDLLQAAIRRAWQHFDTFKRA